MGGRDLGESGSIRTQALLSNSLFRAALHDNFPYRKFCAAHGECHSPNRTAKVKHFATLLESGGEDSPMHTPGREHSLNTKSKAQGEKARGVVESGFSGSPSFVAVVQSADLR